MSSGDAGRAPGTRVSAPVVQRSLAKPGTSTCGAGLVQRKCACGSAQSSVGNTCEECGSRPLQRKLSVGNSDDAYEREADRVASMVTQNQRLAAPLRQTRIPIQRVAMHESNLDSAPPSVETALSNGGAPMEAGVRQEMEARFGYDFSHVRVHADSAANASARHLDARAYTSGSHVVFGAGMYSPRTSAGRFLIAHELTHVIQQGGGSSAIQRDKDTASEAMTASDLIDAYSLAHGVVNVPALVKHLARIVRAHPRPDRYLQDVFGYLHEEWSGIEDNIGAELVARLGEPFIEKVARMSDGLYALSLIYRAIITGDATDYERKHANLVLFAKARLDSPEKFTELTKRRPDGRRTRIFPIRFMRVSGGDYATPEVTFQTDGNLRVKYPSQCREPMFEKDFRTLGDIFGAGDVVNANQVVGIRDYESGGRVEYLPALALIDYANRATESTMGKIIEVSAIAATLGFGGGAVAGGEAAGGGLAATRITSTAIWGARLKKAISVLDTAAEVIGAVAFVIDEQREWISDKLGAPGRFLVKCADVANSAATIYGFGRLATGGVKMVKEFRDASKAARAEAKRLKDVNRIASDEAALIDDIDREVAKFADDVDAAAPQAKPDAAPTKKSGNGSQANNTAGKPVNLKQHDVDRIHASAKAHGIPPKELERQADQLAQNAGDPRNVKAPESGAVDAEMATDGHKFTRNRNRRTWCRESLKKCEIDLGQTVNTNVDAAKAARRAQRDAARQHLDELRKRPPQRGSVGPGWDHANFPDGPGRRWRPGDPPDMPTGGNYPTFSTVRQRAWRNLAHNELELRNAGKASRYTGKAPDITPVEGLSNEDLLSMRRTGTSRPGYEIEHSRIPQRVGRMMEEAGLPANDARRLSKTGDPSNLDPLPQEMHAVVDERAHQWKHRNKSLPAAIDDRIEFPLRSMRNDEIQEFVDAVKSRNIDLGATEAGQKLRKALQAEKAARGHSARWSVP